MTHRFLLLRVRAETRERLRCDKTHSVRCQGALLAGRRDSVTHRFHRQQMVHWTFELSKLVCMGSNVQLRFTWEALSVQRDTKG